jgi:hypothetical protein
MDSSEPKKACQSIWVGLWNGRRHVVFDASIQPSNPEFMLLYFVQGHSLCARKREVERQKVISVRNPDDQIFALEQYKKWASANAQVVATKQSQESFEVENPPPLRKICPQCDGHGTCHYTVGTFADGGHSDGQNFVEYCSCCGGRGFVDDILEF